MDIQPAPDSSKNILNVLDDDCIGEILRRLAMFEDFLNAAWTCKRFMECAKTARRRFKYIAIESSSDDDQFVNVPAHRAPLFLEKFGSLITRIDWTPSGTNPKLSDEIYESMVRFCQKTLRSLSITNYNPTISKQHFFDYLYDFELYDAKPKYIDYVPVIRRLSVSIDTEEENPWYIRKFSPYLRELYVLQDNILTEDMVEDFLKLNPQLESLILSDCGHFTPSLLKIIGAHSTMLHSLVIDSQDLVESPSNVINENLIHLQTLRRLRNLYLSAPLSLELLMNMLAENGAPIEALGCAVMNTETAENVPTLKTLKTLYLDNFELGNGFSDTFVFNLVKSQSALIDLTVDHRDFRMDLVQEIMETLKLGKNLTKLKYVIYLTPIDLETHASLLHLVRDRVRVKLVTRSYTNYINVPQDIQDQSRMWLNFCEHRNAKYERVRFIYKIVAKF